MVGAADTEGLAVGAGSGRGLLDGAGDGFRVGDAFGSGCGAVGWGDGMSVGEVVGVAVVALGAEGTLGLVVADGPLTSLASDAANWVRLAGTRVSSTAAVRVRACTFDHHHSGTMGSLVVSAPRSMYGARVRVSPGVGGKRGPCFYGPRLSCWVGHLPPDFAVQDQAGVFVQDGTDVTIARCRSSGGPLGMGSITPDTDLGPLVDTK